MKTEYLKPLEADFLDIPEVRYFDGHPQQYRFNASVGVFNLKGVTPITKKGQSLTIIPIAYRQFKDDILGMGIKNWIEFFFLNKAYQVCSLLLHGYSVENLSGVVADLFYEDAKLYEIALTIKPTAKENKKVGSKYYIAEFEFETIAAHKVEELQMSVENLNIYRADTLTGEAETKLLFNYTSPILELCE